LSQATPSDLRPKRSDKGLPKEVEAGSGCQRSPQVAALFWRIHLAQTETAPLNKQIEADSQADVKAFAILIYEDVRSTV
jgi:hypothetical protein